MTMEELYQNRCAQSSDIVMHLPTLRALADDCDTVVEFGVRSGNSTVAFLASRCQQVFSYDRDVPNLRLPAEAKEKWTFTQADTAQLATIPACDLLFLDTTHTAAQVRQELRHAENVRTYLAFHDTFLFGLRDEDGATTPGSGILEPILQFLAEHPEWRVQSHTPLCNGLTVLARR